MAKKATRLCPCGYHGDPEHECRCTPDRIRQYQQKISGPLLDRIDIQLDVPRLRDDERKYLLDRQRREEAGSAEIREKVISCRELQLRLRGSINARLHQSVLLEYCALSKRDANLLHDAMSRLKLSNRACVRILKIARTIADLAENESIGKVHLMEAINYRRLDSARD